MNPMHPDYIYSHTLNNVLAQGIRKKNRTGVDTLSYHCVTMRFSVSQRAFPILTGKKVNFNALWAELLWILRGQTKLEELQALGTHIWDQWGTAEACAKFNRVEGDLGPTYGWAWRNFGGEYPNGGGFDQVSALIHEMTINPNSRRLIINAWNPEDIYIVAVPPCPTLVQLLMVTENVFDMIVYQRSGDMFIGVPFDFSAYSLLLCILCHLTGNETGLLHHVIADAHVYTNHVSQCHQYLNNVEDRKVHQLPALTIDEDLRGTGLEGFHKLELSSVKLEGYASEKFIKAPVAE